MKKSISILLVAVMLISLLPMNLLTASANTTEFAGGRGTEEDPYLIETKYHLDNVRNHLDAHFKMIADIEFTDADFAEGGDFYNDGQGWNSIGTNYNDDFDGCFDGASHTISGIRINFTGNSLTNLGLFGANSGNIFNIGLINGQIEATNELLYMSVGAVAGSNHGTISGCYSNSIMSSSSYCGGIVGFNGGTVAECYNAGNISSEMYSGGIVATNLRVISNCYNTGYVYGKSYAGGIGGSNYGNISNCYNLGKIKSMSYGNRGGIVGSNTSNITNCYYLDDEKLGAGSGSDTSVKCSLEQLMKQSTYTSFDFQSIWKISNESKFNFPTLSRVKQLEDQENTIEFAGGAGTSWNPYLIKTKKHLDNVRNYLNAHYKMIADIEFTDADFTEGGDFYNNGQGWEPIGISSALPFVGIFDGNEHKIKNIYANISAEFAIVGLFGYNEGSIKNLSVIDICFSATSTKSGTLAGGISGYNFTGTIQNCDSVGSVTAISTGNSSYYSPYSYAGGIAGKNYRGEIIDSYNASIISTLSYSPSSVYAGGIVGYNEGPVKKCCNVGNITANHSAYDGIYLGGIVGQNYDEIESCYNTGNISAFSHTSCFACSGGISGSSICGTIKNCYNLGTISTVNVYKYSNNYMGGILGINGRTSTVECCYNIGSLTYHFGDYTYCGGIVGENLGTIDLANNCFYLDAISSGIGTGDGVTIKCTPEQLKQKSTYTGFDFVKTWTMTDSETYKLPKLIENPMDFFEKEVTDLKIVKMPTKRQYCEGQEFDPTGLSVMAYYNDSSRNEITDFSITGYSSAAGEKNIVITYGKKTVDFTIHVSSTHDYPGGYVYNDDATYFKNGTKTRTCWVCGYKETITAEGTRLEKPLIDSSKKFTDVKTGAWYKSYIDYAVTYGLLNGTGNGKMEPERTITRAEFVQVLANLAGVDTSNKNVSTSFSDVKFGQWYTPAVKWANENNIVYGVSATEFAPNEQITREQMCTMLIRYVENYLHMTLENKNAQKTFADDAQISSWAKDAVYKCQMGGLVHGVTETDFAPENSADRATVATIMSRFHEQYLR